jgi:Tfp pilus assembly protein PilV
MSHASPRRLRVSRLAGFTILEVMMAAIVMALAITTAITALQRGFASLDTARNLVTAGQIMQSEIEKMRINNWSVVSGYPTTATTLTVDSVFTANPAIGNRFSLTRSVSDPKSDLREITFTISWNNYDGRTMSRSYTTYYARYGLYDYFIL